GWSGGGGGAKPGPAPPADTAAEDRATRRGSAQLNPRQWNAVKLSLAGDKVAIELNGQAVYELPMELALGRQFGLFHYKDQTSAQVRNIILTGRWPDAVPDRLRADLAALGPSEQPGDAP